MKNLNNQEEANPDKIIVSWHIEDIKSLDNNLTDDEAREILANVKQHHDAEIGINWQVLEAHIQMHKTEKVAA